MEKTKTKKTSKKDLVEIKKKIKSKKLIIGKKKKKKKIKLGKVKKVFLSSNCSENIKKDIKYYSRISNVEVVELNQRNDELGIICKKLFPISVLSLSK